MQTVKDVTGSKWGYPFCSDHDILLQSKRDHCDVIFHPVSKLQFFYASEDVFSLSKLMLTSVQTLMICTVL